MPPLSGFKWQFIASLWSLVTLVVLVISIPSTSVPPIFEIPGLQVVPAGNVVDGPSREDSLGESASGGVSLKWIMNQMNQNLNLRSLSDRCCLDSVQGLWRISSPSRLEPEGVNDRKNHLPCGMKMRDLFWIPHGRSRRSVLTTSSAKVSLLTLYC